MIDRMFIQEEKTMLALDKQLAKEKPGGQCSPFSLRLYNCVPSRCASPQRPHGAQGSVSPSLPLCGAVAVSPSPLWGCSPKL